MCQKDERPKIRTEEGQGGEVGRGRPEGPRRKTEKAL